jgi:hypothetical protein
MSVLVQKVFACCGCHILIGGINVNSAFAPFSLESVMLVRLSLLIFVMISRLPRGRGDWLCSECIFRTATIDLKVTKVGTNRCSWTVGRCSLSSVASIVRLPRISVRVD